MTVGELKQVLEKYDDNLLVVLHIERDAIGFHKVLDDDYNFVYEPVNGTFYCLPINGD